MEPEYFLTRLTHFEARDFVEGVARRYRSTWGGARLIADLVARVAGNKDGIELRFPWDEEDHSHDEPTEDEYQELLEARRRTGWL